MIENCCRGIVKEIFYKVVVELREGEEGKEGEEDQEEERYSSGERGWNRGLRFGCLASSCLFPCCLHIPHLSSPPVPYLRILSCSFWPVLLFQTIRQDILCGVCHQYDLIVMRFMLCCVCHTYLCGVCHQWDLIVVANMLCSVSTLIVTVGSYCHMWYALFCMSYL